MANNKALLIAGFIWLLNERPDTAEDLIRENVAKNDLGSPARRSAKCFSCFTGPRSGCP